MSRPNVQPIYKLLEELRESFCRQHSDHAQRRIDPYPDYDHSGSTDCDRSICIKWNNDSAHKDLFLAHELMHYILVLEGATLPVGGDAHAGARCVRSCLIDGLTHHVLIKRRLADHGFSDEMEQVGFDVSDILGHTAYACAGVPLLDRLPQIGLAVFRKSTSADDELLSLVAREGLADLYNAICYPTGEVTIDYINGLSERVIQASNVGDQLELVGVEDYISRRRD